MGNWIVNHGGLFAAAIIVIVLIPIGAALISLYRRNRNPRIEGGVQGALMVESVGRPPTSAERSSTPIGGTITGSGLTTTAVTRHLMAPAEKWPAPGQSLPVLVDPLQPEHFRVLWDQVPALVSTQPPATSRPTQGFTFVRRDADATASGPLQDAVASMTINGRPVDPGAVPPEAIAAAFGGDAAQILGAMGLLGLAGTGTVVGFTQQPGSDQVLFDLTVAPDAGGPAFPATLVATFSPASQRRAAWCQPGAQIPVRYDPAAPAQVHLDVGRL